MADAARKWMEENNRYYYDHEAGFHLRRLLEQLDEHDAYYRKVVNDECAPDEVHCTCVPALRDKIDTLQKQVEGLEKALKSLGYVIGGE
jgi:hypothetical protein